MTTGNGREGGFILALRATLWPVIAGGMGMGEAVATLPPAAREQSERSAGAQPAFFAFCPALGHGLVLLTWWLFAFSETFLEVYPWALAAVFHGDSNCSQLTVKTNITEGPRGGVLAVTRLLGCLPTLTWALQVVQPSASLPIKWRIYVSQVTQ